MSMSGSDSTDESGTGTQTDTDKKPTGPVRLPAPTPRSRLPPGASDATRAVLSYFHGPVYALDRKPHLAQHNTVARENSAPEKVAAAILADVAASLEHQAVKWKGLPAVQQWRRAMAPAAHFNVPLVAHVHLPRAFPQPNASVVWVGDLGIAGRDLCIEFALTETDAGVITGFSYRYDLSGKPFIIPVAEAPEPDPNAVPVLPVSKRGPAKPKSVSISVQAMPPESTPATEVPTLTPTVIPLEALPTPPYATAVVLSQLAVDSDQFVRNGAGVPAAVLFGSGPLGFTQAEPAGSPSPIPIPVPVSRYVW